MKKVLTNYKKDFPIFTRYINQGKPLVYLDSASTAQMSEQVIEAVADFSRTNRANVHRGIYELSERATDCYERARARAQKFINARVSREIIFTRNTTEGINLAASSLGDGFLKKGDRVLTSVAEHHSNFLPWQRLREKGVVLDVLDIEDNGELDLKKVKEAIKKTTKLAALSFVSHVLGTINPVRELAKIFRKNGTLFLVDAAQAAAHQKIDAQKIGCDFLAFSGHKIGAPMGIGVLYAREEILKNMPPFLVGGGMITEVNLKETRWREYPWRFEAGTPNVEGAIGLAAAMDYIEKTGFEKISVLEHDLSVRAFDVLRSFKEIKVLGPSESEKRSGVISFTVEGIHPHDLATILDIEGVCVRAGHHCAMPLMKRLGLSATSRISFWVYNSREDIEKLGTGIKKTLRILGSF